MTVQLANPARLIQEAIAAAFRPPPLVDYLDWAIRNIVFSKRESPEPGPYNPDRFSYFNEILKALGPSDPCRIVTLMKSAQLGGTVLANVFAGGSLDMDPGDLMYAHPTENNAERWSKMKLTPMLRGTIALRAIFPEKSREGGNSTLYKERHDGQGAILISGANSPASLSQVTVARQVQDDLAKWELNTAGDPEVQADSRSRAVTFAKIFKISTPLVMPGCRITKNFEAGSQERLFVPCPHCGHMQSLEWENMLPHLDEEQPDRAYFLCTDPECGGVIEEHHRAQMLEAAEWRAANPKMKRVHRSFYLWSAYSFLQSWAQVAIEWFRAKGDPERERAFLNDTVGLAFKASGEAPPWEGLRDRAERSVYVRGTVPDGALLLTIGLDCQADRVEWQVVAFGRNGRRWVIEYGVTPGHISEADARRHLDGLLDQTWPDRLGRRVPTRLAAIDGNAWTEDVWGWVRRHPASRVIMVRGRGEDHASLLERVRKEIDAAGKKLRYSTRFYNFGTSVLKMALYRNLAKQDPEAPGAIAFPRGLEDEYFRQLTSERRAPIKRLGITVWRWKRDEGQANEGLDTHLQAEAAAIRLGLRSMPDAVWDDLERQRNALPVPALPVPALPVPALPASDEAAAPNPEPQPGPAPPPPAKPAPRRSESWFGDRTRNWNARR